MQIINNNRCFDRRDNTFLLSNRKLADKVEVSSSKVDRLFRTLNNHKLVKKVINKMYNTDGSSNVKSVVMLSPKFLFISYTKSDRWFIGTLWELRDIKRVYEWSRVCRELNGFVDAGTGEIKPFNWYEIDRKADQYTGFDRCYRKRSRCIYNKEDGQDSSQFYNYDELNINKLNDTDLNWINSINKASEFNYPRLDLGSFKSKQVNNIYDIKL